MKRKYCLCFAFWFMARSQTTVVWTRYVNLSTIKYFSFFFKIILKNENKKTF